MIEPLSAAVAIVGSSGEANRVDLNAFLPPELDAQIFNLGEIFDSSGETIARSDYFPLRVQVGRTKEAILLG